ncbi:MAG: sensor histidine kinase [Polyangiaceae bacterium]
MALSVRVAAPREARISVATSGVRGAGDSLATRLAWITGLRLALLVLLLVATAALYLRGRLDRYPFSLGVTFATVASGFTLAAIYAGALRAGRRLQALAWTQVSLDQITWTAIVYVTGGASSGATSFYALTCLFAAILVGLRGAAFSAALGLGFYGLLCAAFAFGWVHAPPDQVNAGYLVQPREIVYPLLLNTLGVTVVALLAGYLADRLRLAGGALQAANRRAMEAERQAVLGRIAAGLAHEIRNPLGSITGSIEMLRESPVLSDDDRRLCDIIRREARRLNDLVGDMVDLSRPRAPKAEATDVGGIAKDVVALAASATRTADVKVVYEGPDEEVWARCDGAQIRQVLWNLVRNAVQATPAGSSVYVRVRRGAAEVQIAVDDEGPGVPEYAGDKIFDESFTTRTHGAGIGLAVVKRIVDDHAPMGARLFVGRSDQGGARFQVTLSNAVAGLPRSLRPPGG